MTPTMARLKALRITAKRFAEVTGLHAVTVAQWDKTRSGRGQQERPAWVDLLLTAWETHPDLIPSPHADSRTPDSGMNIGSGTSFSRSI